MKKSEEKQLKSILESIPENISAILNYAVNNNLENLETVMKVMEKTEKQNLEILKGFDDEFKAEEEKAKVILKDYSKDLQDGVNKLIEKYGIYNRNGVKYLDSKNKDFNKYLDEYTVLVDGLRVKYEKELKEHDEALTKADTELREKYKDDFAKYEAEVEKLKPEYENESDFKPYKFSKEAFNAMPVIPRKQLALLQKVGIIVIEE